MGKTMSLLPKVVQQEDLTSHCAPLESCSPLKSHLTRQDTFPFLLRSLHLGL